MSGQCILLQDTYNSLNVCGATVRLIFLHDKDRRREMSDGFPLLSYTYFLCMLWFFSNRCGLHSTIIRLVCMVCDTFSEMST